MGWLILGIVIGLALGAVGIGATWLFLKAQATKVRLEDSAQVTELQSKNDSLEQQIIRLESDLRDEKGGCAKYLNQLREAEGKLGALDEVTKRLRALDEEKRNLASQVESLRVANAELRKDNENITKKYDERLSDIETAKTVLSNQFKAIAGDVLKQSNTQFLELAKTELTMHKTSSVSDLESRQKAIQNLVEPLSKSVEQLKSEVQGIETKREGAYASLSEQVKQLEKCSSGIQNETKALVAALRKPKTRGDWGEMILKQVVEASGMTDGIHFEEQESIAVAGHSSLIPDMTVKFPGGRSVIVDAKTPLLALLDYSEASSDNDKAHHLQRHAKAVKERIDELAHRFYQKHVNSTEFVVLFLPGEGIYRAALEANSGLLKYAADKKVIIASPSVLLAILWTTKFSWREEKLAASAQKIVSCGTDLYDGLATMAGHIEELRKGLLKGNEAFDAFVGSLERNVLATARKFPELGIQPKATKKDGEKKIPESIESLGRVPRALNSPEMTQGLMAEQKGNLLGSK